MTDTRPAAENWHLDKRIPIALIVTLVLQTGAAVWWASGIAARVSYLEAAAALNADERDRLIILETELKAVNATLQRIERRLYGDDYSQR